MPLNKETKPNQTWCIWKGFIQGQINKIRNFEEDRQSWIAWQAVNEVNKRKRTLWAKLKAASREEWIQVWKEYFKNLLVNFPKVNDNPITKILMANWISKKDSLLKKNSVENWKKIKSRKAAGLNKIPQNYGRINKIITFSFSWEESLISQLLMP